MKSRFRNTEFILCDVEANSQCCFAPLRELADLGGAAGPLFVDVVFEALCICLRSCLCCRNVCPLSAVGCMFTLRAFTLPMEVLCFIDLGGAGELVRGEPARGELVRGELVCGELVRGELACGEVTGGEATRGEVARGGDSKASEKMLESKPSTELCDEAVLPRLLWCRSESVVRRPNTLVTFVALTDLCLPLPQASSDMGPDAEG